MHRNTTTHFITISHVLVYGRSVKCCAVSRNRRKVTVRKGNSRLTQKCTGLRLCVLFLNAQFWHLSIYRNLIISKSNILMNTTGETHGKWAHCQHDEACSQAVHGDSHQTRTVVANMLNKQQRTADKKWSSSLWYKWRLTILGHKRKSCLQMLQYPRNLGSFEWDYEF